MTSSTGYEPNASGVGSSANNQGMPSSSGNTDEDTPVKKKLREEILYHENIISVMESEVNQYIHTRELGFREEARMYETEARRIAQTEVRQTRTESEQLFYEA